MRSLFEDFFHGGSGKSHFPPHVRSLRRGPWGLGLPPNDISGEIFRKLSRSMPIVAVAGSDGQSALPLVGQVGASQDLSEATRRGAVRALWGTVTYTSAGPISFSGCIHQIVFRLCTIFFAIVAPLVSPISIPSLRILLPS